MTTNDEMIEQMEQANMLELQECGDFNELLELAGLQGFFNNPSRIRCRVPYCFFFTPLERIIHRYNDNIHKCHNFEERQNSKHILHVDLCNAWKKEIKNAE